MAKHFNITNFTGVLPFPIPSLITIPYQIAIQLLLFMGFILFAFLIGFLLDKYMVKQWRKPSVLNIILPIIAATLLFIRYGMEMESIKGLVLFMLLLFTSNNDLQTREVDNSIPIMIAITALIGVNTSNIPMMIFACVCVTLPQLLIAVIKPSSYGEPDIKIMAACSFLLGLERRLIAIIVGLSAGLLVTTIIRLIQKKISIESFPVVPYLAIGCIFAYLL